MAAQRWRRRIFWALGIILATLVVMPFISIIFGPSWRMSKDKFYVAQGQQFRQIFSAYIDSPYPVFITSDALLAAFHALNEESAVRLETAQSIRLKMLLGGMAKQLPTASGDFDVDSTLLTNAQARASEILAVAMRLLEDPCPLEYDANRVDATVTQIVQAGAGMGSGMLTSMDLTRFKPRGFYMRSPVLMRYFRAVNWLQVTSFDLENDEQLLSLAILARASQLQNGKSSKPELTLEQFADAYGAFLGQRDDWDLAFVLTVLQAQEHWFQGAHVLERLRDQICKQIAASPEQRQLIDDQPNFQVADVHATKDKVLRLLSAYQLPDAVLFAQTTDPTKYRRAFPTGLEFCAALGSEFAEETLRSTDGSTLANTVEASHPQFVGQSVYHEYCDCLSDLVNEPDPRAPDFLRGTAWQRKSCQTVLSSWAQMRHTWVLQAKPQYATLSEDDIKPPPGFVEPDPEFFESLAALTRRVQTLLVNQGVYSTETSQLLEEAKRSSPGDAVDNYLLNQPLPDLDRAWRLLEQLCQGAARTAERQLAGEKLDAADRAFVSGFGNSLCHAMLFVDNYAAKDDAPRVVDLFANSEAGGILHAAVGRPVAIFVSYPYQGRAIYCRGAVMPYYEFVDPERLDDAQWMKNFQNIPNNPNGYNQSTALVRH